jgi:Mg2+-importing ATPase
VPKNGSKFAAAKVSPELIRAATLGVPEALAMVESSSAGLAEAEAEARLERYGPNELRTEKPPGWLGLLWDAFWNMLNVVLLVLAVITYFTADPARPKDGGFSFSIFDRVVWPVTPDQGGAFVILGMVVLSVTLRFLQELKADNAAQRLKAMVTVTATVIRAGLRQEIPLKHLVPGDIVSLAAGDMIPADVRLIATKDLFLNQASLTGESLPVEKIDAAMTKPPETSLDLTNVCFMGTNVGSGAATAMVVATGSATYLGGMARSLAAPAPAQTSFDRGINSFVRLMLVIMLVMAPLVFLINWLTNKTGSGVLEAAMFALAVAVGLAPEMLPMIVTVCLSKGAIVMSKKKVIVKRLHSIQQFGAMDVLCTDKTGTLTMDRVILEKYCDVVREESQDVLRLAYLNSVHQTGLKNVLDRAILDHGEVAVGEVRKVDEIPFDFVRKIMSVVVTEGDKHRLIAKGAPEEIMSRCTKFELNGETLPMDYVLIEDLREEYAELNEDGFRVLAIAYKDTDAAQTVYSKADEKDLILKGYVAFLDPPKESTREALDALRKYGVRVKVLTGDNDLVTRKICNEVGQPVDHLILGAQVEKMSDEELATAAEETDVFARLSPAHKERIIRALKSRGHVVGFLGDGINDAPALKAADVGISVDTAVDVARDSADIILLEKSLLVLEQGVIEGRRVFANIIKYFKMGASSNFGNMFSVIGASAWLPFLPMRPIQVLTNGLLYDVSQTGIPTDEVDESQVAKPATWALGELKRFIFFIGPISSIFDYTTFFVMIYVFKTWVGKETNADLFQTGWFVESLVTQTLIIHVIRTNKIPFIQSRASWPLIVTSSLVIAFGVWLPFSPLAGVLHFTPLPNSYWWFLGGTMVSYIVLTQLIKTWLVRRGWV